MFYVTSSKYSNTYPGLARPASTTCDRDPLPLLNVPPLWGILRGTWKVGHSRLISRDYGSNVMEAKNLKVSAELRKIPDWPTR